jgi:hypothetical protein
LLQLLQERRVVPPHLGIVCAGADDHPNAPHAFPLLRAGGKRPRNCSSAERRRYELPSSDADCHLPRPQWGHADWNIENDSTPQIGFL